MADLGATFTDAEIKAVEKELKAVYNKAYKELLQKQKDFNKKYAAKEAKKLKQLASGQITQEEFDAWKAGQVFQSKQWEDKKKQILQTTYHTNEIAMGIVNGKISDIFAFNANYTAYQLEHGAGCNFGFGLYDEASVVNIIKNNPQLLPEWKIDQPKDYIWNQKKLNRQVTLGIVEGESLDKIATRLADSLSSQNFNKMRTFARTAMTGAQNAGRQIRLDEAKKLGINVKKEWMATLDAHTRMMHRKLDGQKVDTDKSFDINGMSIRFPGDPLAPAALVYNCRCTMVGDLVNYPSTYDRYDNIDGKRIKGMTYSEWEEAKKNGDNISPLPLTYSQIGFYNQSADLLELFKDKKMSNVYADIKSMNVTEGNKFYKELQGMGKPSEVWAQYINGTLPDEQLKKIDEMLQNYVDKAGLLKDSSDIAKNILGGGTSKPPKIKEIKTLEDAQNALKEAQDAINKAGANKKFIGIWKDPVSYADYDLKKESIVAKKQYYLKQMKKIEDAGNAATSYSYKKYAGYLKDLDDFEKNGQAYSKLFKNLEDAKKKVIDLTPAPSINASGGIFSSDLFTAEAKKASKKFTNRNEADKFHRKYLDSVWGNLTNDEKYGVWEYTRNSNPMNKSLSGYHDSWSRSSFLGLDKTDWGHEDSWRSLPSVFKKYGKDGHCNYHKAITDTTNAIQKCSLPEGVNLVRGSDKGGFAGMIEGDLLSFDQAKSLLNKSESEINKALKGQVIQNHAFTSTGIASGTGFGGDVAYRIYAPKGTHALYAEPQSYFGDTVGSNAKLYKAGQAYRSVGGEAEVILQRGTEFRITNVSKVGGQITVDMEVVAQPDYFVHGDEDTFNRGKTRHKK